MRSRTSSASAARHMTSERIPPPGRRRAARPSTGCSGATRIVESLPRRVPSGTRTPSVTTQRRRRAPAPTSTSSHTIVSSSVALGSIRASGRPDATGARESPRATPAHRVPGSREVCRYRKNSAVVHGRAHAARPRGDERRDTGPRPTRTARCRPATRTRWSPRPARRRSAMTAAPSRARQPDDGAVVVHRERRCIWQARCWARPPSSRAHRMCR